ncbi:MAG: ABC transporter ATP-binding protein [Kiritimatiellae bacterium]|nr:ABC transporter ATP-binding protein [Kiritimatiellia bacterium]
MKLLSVENIVKEYKIPGHKPIRILNDISFEVNEGEHVAIVGRSGAGKTTLLNILGGLDKPNSGDVKIAGVSLYKGFGAERRRNMIRATKVGFVFQSYHLMPELDIVENVILPTMTGYEKILNPRKRAKELLEKVGLGERLGHLPTELSGGEQQRVALARALICSPDIIFADEPTGNLDSSTGTEIMKLLFEINEKPLALVMVTHSSDAANMCDRVLVLDSTSITER